LKRTGGKAINNTREHSARLADLKDKMGKTCRMGLVCVSISSDQQPKDMNAHCLCVCFQKWKWRKNWRGVVDMLFDVNSSSHFAAAVL